MTVISFATLNSGSTSAGGSMAPAGPAGTPGTQGPQGPQGPQGIPGVPLYQIINGLTGPVIDLSFVDLAGNAQEARAASGLNIDELTTVADANYTALNTDRKIAYTSISAARTVTLPAAASVNPGQTLDFFDHYGVCTSSNTVKAIAAGSDTLNGSSSAVVMIGAQYGGTSIRSDGISKWSYNTVSATAGVTSLNSLTGALSVTAGTAVSVSASGSSVQVSSPNFTGDSGSGGATGSVPAPASGNAASNYALLASGAWGFPQTRGGFVNKFRNAEFEICQRGTSGTVGSGATNYTLDGWQVSTTGASVSWAQEYNQNMAGMALRLSCATGLTACTLQQRIESYIAAELLTSAKGTNPVTIQFMLYNNSGANLTAKIATGYASAQDNFGTVTGDLSATSLQTIANAQLAVVAYTYTPGSSSITNGLQIQLQFGSALNASSGYVDIGRADIRVTTGLSTGQQSNPPPHEQRPVHVEQSFCERYLITTYAPGVAAGTASQTDAGEFQGIASSSSGLYSYGSWFFRTVMRAAPTPTFYNPSSGTAGQFYDYTSSAANGTPAYTGVTAKAISNIYNSSSSWTSGHAIGVHITASAEL